MGVNIDPFMKKHIRRHTVACWTVYRFLQGREQYVDIIQWAIWKHPERIAANIYRNNPLLRKI